MEKRRIHKRFRVNPALIIIVFLSILLGSYVVVRFLGMMSQTIESVTVNRMTAYESISGTGWLIREETIVRNTQSENVKHLISNGDKVGVGTVLAQVYSSESAMDSAKQLDALDNEIVLMQTALQSAGNYSDAAKVDQLISNQLDALASHVENGICTQLDEYSQELRQLSLRRNASVLNADNLDSKIESLRSQRNTLALRIERQVSEIRSGASGYFTEVVDGYENILSYNKISEMTAEEFETLIIEEPREPQNAFGKIVKGFQWHFAMTVSSEEAQQLNVGKTVTLRFNQIAQDITSEVVSINTGENSDLSLVIFKSSHIANDVLVNRRLGAEIILKSHTGLKVPTNAVHLVTNSDGSKQLGVYILTGSTSRFKEINPIYQGENYYIVVQENSDKALVAGDNVIVRGLNLADGKALK